MRSLFKRKPKKRPLIDLHGSPLAVGDWVNCLRYDMGRSEVKENEEGIYYVSAVSGQEVPWFKMVDAISQRQKVEKLE